MVVAGRANAEPCMSPQTCCRVQAPSLLPAGLKTCLPRLPPPPPLPLPPPQVVPDPPAASVALNGTEVSAGQTVTSDASASTCANTPCNSTWDVSVGGGGGHARQAAGTAGNW